MTRGAQVVSGTCIHVGKVVVNFLGLMIDVGRLSSLIVVLPLDW